ncbi:hypothetical protein C8F04DRAFT_1275019 [Mycena alexandri]|uniref:Uncharacterized protein n=1 Tax=Mycena alexandri TaxID=1745969 RepID=A0AAD6WPN5_9AGAR|nr:hypothetical protein C8F04DRAFT_1275019 [Mycena alexandri]
MVVTVQIWTVTFAPNAQRRYAQCGCGRPTTTTTRSDHQDSTPTAWSGRRPAHALPPSPPYMLRSTRAPPASSTPRSSSVLPVSYFGRHCMAPFPPRTSESAFRVESPYTLRSTVRPQRIPYLLPLLPLLPPLPPPPPPSSPSSPLLLRIAHSSLRRHCMAPFPPRTPESHSRVERACNAARQTPLTSRTRSPALVPLHPRSPARTHSFPPTGSPPR